MPRDTQVRILVIDDDPEIRQVLKRVLLMDERIQQVDTAQDGAEAFASLGPDARYDIVIADERLPDTRGVQILTYVRSHHPNMVRILISGFRDQAAAVEGINKARIDQYLEKPIELADLVNRLFDLVESREIDATVNGEVFLNAKDMARLIHQRKKGDEKPAP